VEKHQRYGEFAEKGFASFRLIVETTGTTVRTFRVKHYDPRRQALWIWKNQSAPLQTSNPPNKDYQLEDLGMLNFLFLLKLAFANPWLLKQPI